MNIIKKYGNEKFKKIEENWQSIWEDNKLANCDVTLNKNNFYNSFN